MTHNPTTIKCANCFWFDPIFRNRARGYCTLSEHKQVIVKGDSVMPCFTSTGRPYPIAISHPPKSGESME